ncbi:hypothetical protein TcWFU_003143 [Taenia crassiceps]|uniref:UDP-galactose transporter n=1 Tax=Taenia crassiceps TaxID=6207 RepID=A0ABR4QQ63_9CEST
MSSFPSHLTKLTLNGNLMKYGSLAFLTLQNVVLVLLSRYVRARPGDMFISSTAVTMSEVVKLAVCVLLVWLVEEGGSVRGFASNLHANLLIDWRDNLLICVPGTMYAVQNNLIYLAVSHLNASVFQVTYQLKVFTTVLFFRILLHRVLTPKHWIALSLLFVGVVTAQVDPGNSVKTQDGLEQKPFFGLICVITACVFSGFSGVFFELVLKSTQKTIVMRNIQLSVCGILASLAQAYLQEWEVILNHGFLLGYDGYVWVVILVQSLGGLLVAAVVRYADNILKTFATSVAIALTLVASVLLFGTPLSVHLVVGNVLVITATVLYGFLPPPASVKPIGEEEERRGGATGVVLKVVLPDGLSRATLPFGWHQSRSDLRENGFLMRTFDQVFNSTDAGLVYGMYNDEVPPNLTLAHSIWYGHMKGLFAFTENEQGFWLTHSVPKLSMKPGEFVYPETGKRYAQHFFCVSLNYSALKTIADHLIISRPLIQGYKLPESVGKSIPLLRDIFHGSGLKNISQSFVTNLSGVRNNLTLRQFTKSHAFHHDLFSEMIGPNLKGHLYTETWRHGDSNLPSNCTTEFWVKNIEELKWPAPMNVDLRSTFDHAKWAVTAEGDAERWICFGDINRSGSQFARGGGALCVEHPKIWKRFYNLVVQVEACPAVIPWTKLHPALPLS